VVSKDGSRRAFSYHEGIVIFQSSIERAVPNLQPYSHIKRNGTACNCSKTRFIYGIADRGTTEAFPPSCAARNRKRSYGCHSALGRLKEGVTSEPEVAFTIPALVPNPQNNPRLQASPTASCDDHSPGNWIGALMKRGRGTIRVAHTFHEVVVHRRWGGTFATMSSP
jgi:hypothetical protein